MAEIDESTDSRERAAGLGARRDRLAEQLRRWNAEDDEDKTVKTTRELIEESDQLTRAEREREIQERIRAEVEQRVEKALAERRQAPQVYRRDLSPKQKSELMQKLGDRYLLLPWQPPRR